MKHFTLIEDLRGRFAIMNADITTPRTSAWVHLDEFKDAREVLAIMITGEVTAAKIATLEFLQAKDNAGTDAKDLAAPWIYTAPTGNGNAAIIVHAYSEELDQANGFEYIAVRISSNNAIAVAGAAILGSSSHVYKPTPGNE